MKKKNADQETSRRGFLGKMAAGATAIGLSTVAPVIKSLAAENSSINNSPGDPEEMFKKITGKHRIVFDATQPHGIYPFAWPRVFLLTNEMTGTMSKDCSVVVVLRHSAIGYAMESRLWEKYKMGELFEAMDPATSKPAVRNPFWKPAPGTFKVPGIGEVMIGVDQLQKSGVLFCVCEAAITVYSAVAAGNMNLDAAEVRKEWVAGLLPDIQLVPSGVWALGRAQEKQCGYIFAG